MACAEEKEAKTKKAAQDDSVLAISSKRQIDNLPQPSSGLSPTKSTGATSLIDDEDLRLMLANDAYSQAAPAGAQGHYMLDIDPNDESSHYPEGTVD